MGLLEVPAKVRQHLEQARHWVDELVDKYLDKFIDLAKKLWHKGKQAAAGAVEGVKGWLGLSQAIKLVNGEQHTLYFDAQGDLLLASTPAPYEKFLKNYKRLPQTDPDKTAVNTLLTQAKAKSAQIRAAEARAKSAADQAAQLQIQTEISTYLVELGHLTQELMQYNKGTQNPENVPVLLATRNGWGTGMSVEYKGSKSDHPMGTGTSDGNDPPLLKILKQRKKGKEEFYKRGHLLSQKLGGSGTNWRNLVPLSPKGNKQHELQVEEKLIGAVNKAAKPIRFYYSVVPQYGRPRNAALLQSDKLKARLDKDVLKAVIEAEQYVPLALTCNVRPVNDNHEHSPGSDLNINVSVPNDLEDGSSDLYETVLNPLSTRPKLFINSKGLAIATIQSYGFSSAQAQAIRKIVQASTPPKKSFADRGHLLAQVSELQNPSDEVGKTGSELVDYLYNTLKELTFA